MPNYSFKCSKCELRFEKSLKLEMAESKIKCPSCNSMETSKLPSKGIGFKFAEPKKIPKDIDKLVGQDAEKRWLEYEEKNKLKEKIRKESGTEKLSIDLDGNYQPFSMNVDGKQVTGEEGAKYRKEMLNDYLKIKRDPETVKNIPDISKKQE